MRSVRWTRHRAASHIRALVGHIGSASIANIFEVLQLMAEHLIRHGVSGKTYTWELKDPDGDAVNLTSANVLILRIERCGAMGMAYQTRVLSKTGTPTDGKAQYTTVASDFGPNGFGPLGTVWCMRITADGAEYPDLEADTLRVI